MHGITFLDLAPVLIAPLVILIIILIAAILIRSIRSSTSKATQHWPQSSKILGKAKKQNIYYKYQKRKFLLTKNESLFYKKLLPVANEMNLTICFKVRLADLIEPCTGQNWQAAFNRIKAKHIDFVLCEASTEPILAIELDDNSHDRQDRVDRDLFVDDAMKSAQLPILHTRNTENLKDKITRVIQK